MVLNTDTSHQSALPPQLNRKKNCVIVWRWALAGWICITGLNPALAENIPASLDRLVQQAIQSHPSVLSAAAEFEATRIDAKTARLQWTPTPSLQSRVIEDGVVSRVRVDQPLWTNGRITASIQQAQLTAQTADANIALQRYTIASQVIDAWVMLLQAQEKIQIADQSYAQLSQYQGMMQRRVAAEISARIELDLIQSRILQSQVNRSEAVAAARLAAIRLQELSRMSITDAAPSLPSIRQLALQVTQDFEQQQVAQLRPTADQHPAVRKASYQAAAAAEVARVRRAELFPSVALSYSKDLSSQQSAAVSEHGLFALELQYTPDAGFSSWGRRKAADARLQALEQSKSATQSEIYMQLHSSLQDYSSAAARMTALQAAAQGAEAVRGSYERQFSVGRKSWLDVMNAAREVEQNAYQLADAQARLLAAYYHLKLQSGQLLRQLQGAE